MLIRWCVSLPVACVQSCHVRTKVHAILHSQRKVIQTEYYVSMLIGRFVSLWVSCVKLYRPRMMWFYTGKEKWYKRNIMLACWSVGLYHLEFACVKLYRSPMMWFYTGEEKWYKRNIMLACWSVGLYHLEFACVKSYHARPICSLHRKLKVIQTHWSISQLT